MYVTSVRIRNFRCIEDVEIVLGETTVFLGQNNAGKTAVLDAIRVALTRRWGQRGTGFTENDIHRTNDSEDVRKLPPVTIDLNIEEPKPGEWDPDMVAVLDDIMAILPTGRNAIKLRVTCAWSDEEDAFTPLWEFLDEAGVPMTGKAQRATNLSAFFRYLPFFWLGPLRDAATEFTPRSGHWGRLLKGVRVPDDVEADVLESLADLDSKVVASDVRLTKIADLIGKATQIAIGEGPGSAKLSTLPMTIEDMLQRTGIVLRNETERPWLPLGHHGQGLQSLAVIFLFQAAVLQQITEEERPGMGAIFCIEEPEVHLHPQAARTLWERVSELPGQRLMSTHSPYFAQHVPLRDLRLLRLEAGRTNIASIPEVVVSSLPWNEKVEQLSQDSGAHVFAKDPATGRVAAKQWIDQRIIQRLIRCYREDPEADQRNKAAADFRHACRILLSRDDERTLDLQGRRVRGEIFFASRWLLVEGPCEFALLHSLGHAFGWPLDTHGVAVIDFKLAGDAPIYAALAEGLGFPWHMIVDGDNEGLRTRARLLKRGFREDDLDGRVESLPPPNTLEHQLLNDGHEELLHELLGEAGRPAAENCSTEELRTKLKKHNTAYMHLLSLRVAGDPELAERMPKVFIDYVKRLREGKV